MGEFEFNVPPEVARPLLIKTWPQRYMTFKNSVRPYFKSDDPFGVGPLGVDPNIWKEFVQNEMDPKKKLQKTKNLENRKKLEYSHTLGKRTYANKLHQKKEKEPEKKFKRVDSWFMGHEREDGSVLKSAKKKYDQLKEVCKKRQSTSTDGEGSSSSMYDLGNDELTEVFGKDNNGGVRAVGSHISKKQLIHLGIADAHAEQKSKAKEDVSNVVFRLDGVDNTMKDMLKILTDMSKGNFTVPVMTTPISDVDSYSAPPLDKIFTTMGASQHSHPIHPPMDKSQVILCDKFGKHLAKGYVETISTREVCHGKKIGRGEKIVYVEEIFVPDAIIWDSSQTLVEYVEGGISFGPNVG